MLDMAIKLWKSDSGLQTPVMFKYTYDNKTLTIYTTSPGWLIGRGGKLYDEYKNLISKQMCCDIEIEFVEVNHYIL